MVVAANLGFPRIGGMRELKKAVEAFWAKKLTQAELLQTAQELRGVHWNLQKKAGVAVIPSNDFSFYDHILDASLALGVIPQRYQALLPQDHQNPRPLAELLDVYFAMARGRQTEEIDVPACEMTKYFDTNYHFLVPEFEPNAQYRLLSTKIIDEFVEARDVHGIVTRPVIIGPVSYALLGKGRHEGHNVADVLAKILPVYAELVTRLQAAGAQDIQFDEPCLVCKDLTAEQLALYKVAYADVLPKTYRAFTAPFRVTFATYFEFLDDAALAVVKDLEIDVLHADVTRIEGKANVGPVEAPLDAILKAVAQRDNLQLSLGCLDGRNIWKTDLTKVLNTVVIPALQVVPANRLLIAPSCSLLHVPVTLNTENALPEDIKGWLSFAEQKLEEIVVLAAAAAQYTAEVNTAAALVAAADETVRAFFAASDAAAAARVASTKIHIPEVKARVAAEAPLAHNRFAPFAQRVQEQQELFKLPLFPTTTIGSFPQTDEIRQTRAAYKAKKISDEEYHEKLHEEIKRTVQWQIDADIDVLVEGECERNDMVEYFASMLTGFTSSKFGWVQSYGSRCVKPPIIFGDVKLDTTKETTVPWITYAQNLVPKDPVTGNPTKRVKGMLTGPVTILGWSFVRDDQPRRVTCEQIGLAIRDEVLDLEKNDIKIIQIDEAALREGLPLREKHRKAYLDWAVHAFKMTASGVQNTTQIHTHMCYSAFNDIIEHIGHMDADVISIECSRAKMTLLDAFASYNYPNHIGPGVYDIHSPRIPSNEEIILLIEKACEVLSKEQLWINPDCGLKTRKWPEVSPALLNMVACAKQMRAKYQQ